MIRRITIVAVVALVAGWTAADAEGQLLPRYQQGGVEPGRRPTLSPYLDLLRVNPGPLPNYYQFVRPKFEQQRQAQQQWQAIRGLRTDTRRLQQQPEQLPATGGGGHYQNYLHFYRSGTGRR